MTRSSEQWNMTRGQVFEVQAGWVAIGRSSKGIVRCTVPLVSAEAAEAELKLRGLAIEPDKDELLGRVVDLLHSYFAGRPTRFTVPLDLDGLAPFTRRVLEECHAIPYGETITYGALAARAGRPGVARGVGQVMARNPIAIIVPCHRVVGAGGQLVGFGGGLDMKRTLLEMERQGLEGR
jgi:methylated-DNA-[protein]-cysteine S-methyltransferase